MPVLGFGRDKKIGLGLWKYSRIALIMEVLLYSVSTLVVIVPWQSTILLLVLGLVFTLPFIGSSASKKTDSKKMINIYSIMGFVGFIIFALIANFLIGFNW